MFQTMIMLYYFKEYSIMQNMNRKLVTAIFHILYFSDQYFRIKLGKLKNMTLIKSLWILIKILDFFNRIILIKVLSSIGWPSPTIYGERSTQVAFLIIQHSDLDILIKFLRPLSIAVTKGDASRKHYAMVIDRILLFRGKKQIYGSQISKNRTKKNDEFYIYPLLNPQKVNARRLEAGFSNSLEEYAKEMNARIDIP